MSALLDELAQLIGRPAAFAVIGAYGGTRFHVPKVAHATHPLVASIGESLFEALCKTYGGEVLDLPLPPTSETKRLRIIELDAAGGTTREIALACGCTERHVRNVLAEDELRRAHARAGAR